MSQITPSPAIATDAVVDAVVGPGAQQVAADDQPVRGADRAVAVGVVERGKPRSPTIVFTRNSSPVGTPAAE